MHPITTNGLTVVDPRTAALLGLQPNSPLIKIGAGRSVRRPEHPGYTYAAWKNLIAVCEDPRSTGADIAACCAPGR